MQPNPALKVKHKPATGGKAVYVPQLFVGERCGTVIGWMKGHEESPGALPTRSCATGGWRERIRIETRGQVAQSRCIETTVENL